jgi:pyruvate/2-oxoglutarate dehydrogenase complex dihydrolipoamide acyltransferase (E2) component
LCHTAPRQHHDRTTTESRPHRERHLTEIFSHRYVALTYDHRIIDGGDAVTFLKDIKELIEDPHRLLLEL